MTYWRKLGFVLASKYRSRIVLALQRGPRRPKELSEELGLYLSHVSSTLSDLEGQQIASCLTPNLRKGRIYGLTELGERIAAKIRNR